MLPAPIAPELTVLTETRIRRLKPWRRARKLSDSGGLCLLVVPSGSPYWRFNYRFQGKQKTLALGIYPYVSLEKARARHQWARRLLSAGIDPSSRRRELRQRSTAPAVGPVEMSTTARGYEDFGLPERH